ncbi:MMPL family transporter [Azospirillum sp.]|uniref:MMPL family transporter n=1 Tax=Azospirillum sp. TaxID=34012 RepID=UPI003D7272AD
MRRLAALLWLAIVLLAGGYLALRIHDGLGFRTDLLALLPREEQDPVLQRANDAVTKALGRRVLALVGHADRATARDAAAKLGDALLATGQVERVGEGIDADRLKRLGGLYFPHRLSLLSNGDRALLAADKGEEIATRALSQAFGFAGLVDAGLLRTDPFLLLPSFLTNLPFPLSRLAPDEGMLTVVENGTTWVLVSAVLAGEPFELDLQDRLVGAVDAAVGDMPGVTVKRLGAVFFAHAGSQTAIAEASTLSTLSLVGTMLLVVLVFRRAGPLLHNVLALAVGMAVGLSGSLLLFGELHVAALLFGSSLIGVAVDYSLHYSACLFDPEAGSPRERLRHVLPGITLGLVTTLIGYAALMLAPFPGLRQIAAFSIIGLLGAFLTVVLWLPPLDRARTLTHGAGMLRAASRLWGFWEDGRWRGVRAALLLGCVAAGVVGLARLSADDDVRRLQAVSADLKREQDDIQRLIGATTAAQFLLVQGADDETALRRQEDLAGTLGGLKAKGAIAGYQMPAAFVPSARTQRENRALVASALHGPWLATQRARLGLPPAEPDKVTDEVLTLERALAADAVPFLRDLVLGPGLHVVALQGLSDPDAVRAAVAGTAGVRLVDPTADFSALLAKYRHRALLLTGLAGLLMLPVLGWRYGLRGALWTLVPPGSALILAPAAVGLMGQDFTFFHAMALVLILSIGVDYAVFCAESGVERQPVTMLAVWLATLTTILSFGLLAFSGVPAVHSFGVTMLVGISIAFLFAPLAARGARQDATTNGARVL